jgi:hypothetical protein
MQDFDEMNRVYLLLAADENLKVVSERLEYAGITLTSTLTATSYQQCSNRQLPNTKK